MNTSSKSCTELQPLLGFPYKGGTYFFYPEQIIRLKADSNYTFIYVNEQKPIMMAKGLADYEELLSPFGFMRTHRSHLINKLHVYSINNAGRIVMDDMSEAEISRRKRKEVLKKILMKEVE